MFKNLYYFFNLLAKFQNFYFSYPFDFLLFFYLNFNLKLNFKEFIIYLKIYYLIYVFIFVKLHSNCSLYQIKNRIQINIFLIEKPFFNIILVINL